MQPISGLALTIPVGAGELIDKITILRIKQARIHDDAKLRNVEHELSVLEAARSLHLEPSTTLSVFESELQAINEALWKVEDDIRDCEARADFGSEFIELARSVYRMNDQRAALKRSINEHCGSEIVEEKSYASSS